MEGDQLMGKPKRHLKKYSYQRNSSAPISLVALPWDMGANGQANRIGLHEEDATELDPATGKPIPNPNGVKRQRRLSEVEMAYKAGLINAGQYAAAKSLVALAGGSVIGGNDPIAAIVIKSPTGEAGDPGPGRVDRRRKFFAEWSKVPAECRHALEEAIVNDIKFSDVFGRKLCDLIDGYAKIRVGLSAINGDVI
jgi:hypothetical protein